MKRRLLARFPLIVPVLADLVCQSSLIVSAGVCKHFQRSSPLLSFQCPAYFSTNNMPPTKDSLKIKIEELIKKNKVMIFSKGYCPFCKKTKALFDQLKVNYNAIELDEIKDGPLWQEALASKTNRKTVPQVFVNGTFIGGCDDTIDSLSKGTLTSILFPRVYEYDLIVIGGGSGGLAAAKEAARLGRKVALVNYVVPSPIGSTWGLGGTCVNVGCIPKKLMHQAALIGSSMKDSSAFGWKTESSAALEINKNIFHDWHKLRDNIQSHIKSLNFGYKVALRKLNIENINAWAAFQDQHKLKLVNDAKEVKYLTADRFLIATGTRPDYPNIPGAVEYGVTSDDLFSLAYPPGKTLVIGASYVALECAGFLVGFGYDVTVMVRSILLRGFDQECAIKAGEMLEHEGVKFTRPCVPEAIEQVKPGTPGVLRVTGKSKEGKVVVSEYNTVVFAIGRSSRLGEMGLDRIGVKLSKNGKIPVKNEQTNVPHVFAVGDCIDTKWELAPVAIEAGLLLARRLYAGSNVQCDYENIATTVFTPVEYGSAGFSEEEALERFGADALEIYIQNFTPLEWTVSHRPENKCFAKIICLLKEQMRIIGFHYVGPNAGEVTQLASLCVKKKCTKEDFDALIGIHPTCAEVFTTMSTTKRSGKTADAAGC